MAGNALTVAQRPSILENWTPDQVDLIKRTVAAGASDDELELFLSVSREVGLNPLLKQVWCVKQLDQNGAPKKDPRGNEYPAQIMVGRDGFLALAERSGKLAGVVSGVVKEGDTFVFGLNEPIHEFGETRTKIVGAYCYVYRNDRRYPLRVFAEWAEHGAPMTRKADGSRINLWSPWSKTPSLMIRKVAEANALKLSFAIAGVTAADSPEDEIVDAETVDAEIVEDHRRPVGYSAETGSAETPGRTGGPGEEPDVTSTTSGAGSGPVPAGDDDSALFPPDNDEDPEAPLDPDGNPA